MKIQRLQISPFGRNDKKGAFRLQYNFSCSSQQAAIYRLNTTLLILLIPLALLLYSQSSLAQDEQKGKQVFTRKQLETLNARTLEELLDALPGVSDGGSRIRGSSGGVVIFIDDRRITDAATKKTNLWGYSAMDIERIEIIKGAGAAAYGNDTAGGVILITKVKGKRGLSRLIEMYAGTLGNTMLRGKITQEENGSSRGGCLTLFYKEKDDKHSGWKEIVLKDLFYKRDLDNKEKFTVGLNAYYGSYKPAGLTHFPTPNAEVDVYDWNLNGAYNKGVFKSQTYYTGRKEDYRNPDIDYRSEFLSQLIGETINYVMDFPILGKTPIGAEAKYNVITSVNFDTHKQDEIHLFGAKSWKANKWLCFDAGLRLSRYSEYGEGINPEATITLSLDNWSIKTNANQSYNSPSIHDRFHSTTYTKGNPDLDMEKVTNYSLGFAYNPAGRFGFSAGGFYSRIADAVTQVRYGDITTYENLDSTTRKGADASLNIKAIEDVNLNLSYVYLIAKNDDTDLYLVNKPDHTFKYTLTSKYNNFSFMHKGIYTSWYYSNSMNTEKQPGRYLADVRLTYTKKSWQIYLEATNLFDKDYEEYRGKPGYGRNIKVGMQWDF